MDSLEQRIIRLEAIEAIKQLKSHYALCADAKYTEDHERKPQEEIDKVIWEVATLAESNQAVFLSATLEDDYVCVDGIWYTKAVRMTNRFMTPFQEPWTIRQNQPYTP